jgi:hypothetical protein
MPPNEHRAIDQTADGHAGVLEPPRGRFARDGASRLRVVATDAMADGPAAARVADNRPDLDVGASAGLRVPRGIALGVAIAVPLWAALIAVGYWLFG